MNIELLLLRLVHVLGGVFWVGSMLFMVSFLTPTLARLGTVAGRVMAGLQERRHLTILPAMAVLTVLFAPPGEGRRYRCRGSADVAGAAAPQCARERGGCRASRRGGGSNGSGALRAVMAGFFGGVSVYQFNVPDMTCGHCASTIAKALKSEDPKAKVEISLGERLVKVYSELAEDEIAERITEAGYTPTAVA